MENKRLIGRSFNVPHALHCIGQGRNAPDWRGFLSEIVQAPLLGRCNVDLTREESPLCQSITLSVSGAVCLEQASFDSLRQLLSTSCRQVQQSRMLSFHQTLVSVSVRLGHERCRQVGSRASWCMHACMQSRKHGREIWVVSINDWLSAGSPRWHACGCQVTHELIVS